MSILLDNDEIILIIIMKTNLPYFHLLCKNTRFDDRNFMGSLKSQHELFRSIKTPLRFLKLITSGSSFISFSLELISGLIKC